MKKNEYVELEEEIWFQLAELGLEPGISLYYQGIKVTKKKEFAELNLVAKWRRNHRNKCSKETWYILTNLNSLSAATSAYSKRMGIEEMFRDLKLGGYNLESTQVENNRLISLILLITLAYSYSRICHLLHWGGQVFFFCGSKGSMICHSVSVKLL